MVEDPGPVTEIAVGTGDIDAPVNADPKADVEPAFVGDTSAGVVMPVGMDTLVETEPAPRLEAEPVADVEPGAD